jgi:hypothetical protein
MKKENPGLGGNQAGAVEKSIIQQNDNIAPPSKFQARAKDAIGLTVLPSCDQRLLESALTYAKQGVRVFPLHGLRNGRCTCGTFCGDAAGKHPRIADGFRAASTNLPQIRKWWRKWPDANIGIATGAASGLAVLEANGPEGLAAIRALVGQHGPFPETATAKTPHGIQFYFLMPKGRPVPSVLCDGIEFFADAGFVVAPPSVVPLFPARSRAYGRC